MPAPVRRLTRWLVPALAVAGLPVALAVSTVTAPAASAAAPGCTGTVEVTEVGTGASLGWVQAPSPDDFNGPVVAYTGDPGSATDIAVTKGADGYYSIAVAGGSQIGGTNYTGHPDFSADQPDFSILLVGDGRGGLWTLDGTSLTASWPNADGTRVPLHIYDDAITGHRNNYTGLGTNLAALESSYGDEDFHEITWTFEPDEGADCSFTTTPACSDARDVFDAVKVRMQAAKQRLRDARDSGNQHAIDKAKAHKQKVRGQRADAKADVLTECDTASRHRS